MLDAHPAVAWVRYPGLADNPYHALAQKYLPKGRGAVFTFGVEGGRAAGKAFIEKLELVSHLANVGDAKTLVIHPGQHDPPADERRRPRRRPGIGPEMIRISVGLETIEDVLWDLDQALRASQDAARQSGGRHVGGSPMRPRGQGTGDRGQEETRPPLPLGEGVGVRGPRPSIRASRTPRTIRRIYGYARTIAMVGLSPNRLRPSFFVGQYLQYRGYRVVPVNPTADRDPRRDLLPDARGHPVQGRRGGRLPGAVGRARPSPRRPSRSGRGRSGSSSGSSRRRPPRRRRRPGWTS